jgi:membrane-bound lytic murein transglycosylase D
MAILVKVRKLRSWLAIFLCFPALAFAIDSSLFPQPEGLKPDVRFWSRVYTEVTTSEGFIHDSKHLGVVYERISFSPGTPYQQRQKEVKNKKKHIEKLLLELSKSESSYSNSRIHKRIKNVWPVNTDKKEFKEASKRIRFQLGQADRFKEGLVRSGRWQPYIRQQFKELNIPYELASLPHVESSFRPDARSHAGAAGLWQFTRSTGRRYMRIDHVVDERLDPFIASRAAGQLLKNNHEITETWPLALTAYNHGAAGMRRAVQEMGGTQIERIVREYKGRTFGFASRNFYNAFLAALDIDQHPEKYFGEVRRDKPVKLKKVALPSYYTASGLIEAFGAKNNLLKSLNPALQSTVWSNSKLVPKGYHFRVPEHEAEADAKNIIANISSVEQSKQQKPDVSYKIRKGDALSSIARRFKVSVNQLVAINGLRSRHKIRIGQVLKLPYAAKASQEVAKNVTQETIIYNVEKGDLLSVIARRAGVSEGSILALNKLKNKNHLAVGQQLRLRKDPTTIGIAANEKVFEAPKAQPAKKTKEPVGGDKSQLRADPSNYLVGESTSVEVQSNETMGHFADWLKLKTQRLRTINNMAFKESLVVGKQLKLDFSNVNRTEFEKKRLAYHLALQEVFFKTHRVVKTEKRTLRKGESVWMLTQATYHAPMWLMRQHNPTIDFRRVNAGTKLIFPTVVKKSK